MKTPFYVGKLEMENGKFNFINQEKGWKVSLDDEQIARLKPVSKELGTVLLNADYALNMSIGSLPDSIIDTIRTGMKWHD
jgi:hypothetical protein